VLPSDSIDRLLVTLIFSIFTLFSRSMILSPLFEPVGVGGRLISILLRVDVFRLFFSASIFEGT